MSELFSVSSSGSHLAALSDNYIHVRNVLATISGFGSLHFLYNVHALGDLAEDNVLAIQERGGHSSDEELRAICSGSSILRMSC